MEPAILIYDGACPVCQRARDWIAAREKPGAFRFLPCQDEERARLAPQVAEADCMRAMYLVLPDGETHAGAEALPHIFPRLRRQRWLGWVFYVPGARLAAPLLYALIARNRMALSGLLVKKEAEAACDIDKGCK